MHPASLLFLIPLLSPLPAMATETPKAPPRPFSQQPMNLRADSIELDQKTGMSLYRGHVVFTQGTLRLTAARATARSVNNVIDTVTADGTPVTFRYRPEQSVEYIEGDALRAVYHAPTRRVDLYKDVNLRRGRDTFRAAVAYYDIENRSLIAEGDAGRRVVVALVPRASRLLPGDKP
jgi:lipopolysaccharide export system protein LptA